MMAAMGVKRFGRHVLNKRHRAGAHPSPATAKPGSIRMVAVDLDGTLLRSDKGLTRRSADVIRRVSEAGVHVVLDSARSPRTCREIHRALELDTYQINYNGALIYDATNDAPWHHQPLPAKLVRRVVDAARGIDPDVAVSLEVRDQWHTDRVDPTLLTESARHESPHRLAPMHELLTGPITKCMLLAPAERLRAVHQAVRARFGRRIGIHISDQHLIQIVHKRVDKGRALARIARAYGIKQEEVMAIGDAPNDAAMLRWASLGVAVDNAWPAARQAADVVTAANDDDGVAEALQRYVLDCRILPSEGSFSGGA
jgi:Cof subfamily protein (haloacid dehalogenase superfamily)